MFKSLWSYHSRLGHTYIPSLRSRVPFENGGYLLQTNSAGFRSDREFVRERPPGGRRALLFGDSQTAGNGVANSERFSDRLEQIVPGLEVYNYAVTMTGPEQHYLAYLESRDVEHDLVIVGLHVENIARIGRRFIGSLDREGREAIYARPYYQLEGDELVLGHVPVPKRPWTPETLPAEWSHFVYRTSGRLRHKALREVAHRIRRSSPAVFETLWTGVQKVTRMQPVPEYDDPQNPSWLLLRAILQTWIRDSRVPVLIVPLPMWQFTEGLSDTTAYQTRFRELAADTGSPLHDPLPDLQQQYSDTERRSFRFKTDNHLSPHGHQALAESLAPAIRRLLDKEGSMPSSPPVYS